MPNPFDLRFKDMDDKLRRTLLQLPAIAGAIVVKHSDQAFRDQGWTDHTLQEWTPRASEDAKDRAKLRHILIKTGRLRRSVRVIQATLQGVIVGTDVPYARIHNEGGQIHHPQRDGILNFSHTPANGLWRFGKVQTINQQRGIKAIRRVTYKAHTTTMPMRKFLGNSHQQTEEIKFTFTKHILKAFKIS